MSEAINYRFELREVAEALIKRKDLHRGLWMVTIEFGLEAANVPTGPDTYNSLLPAAINIIRAINLKKCESPTNLAVDAAEVNPAKKRRAR